MEILDELGYRFNEEALRQNLENFGQELVSKGCIWYKIIAPFVVAAYEQGREGNALSELFPFLEAVEQRCRQEAQYE